MVNSKLDVSKSVQVMGVTLLLIFLFNHFLGNTWSTHNGRKVQIPIRENSRLFPS